MNPETLNSREERVRRIETTSRTTVKTSVVLLTDVIEAMGEFVSQDYANPAKVHASVCLNIILVSLFRNCAKK